MKYRLVYTRRALRDIGGLDEVTKKRIGKTLARYASDLLRYGDAIMFTAYTKEVLR